MRSTFSISLIFLFLFVSIDGASAYSGSPLVATAMETDELESYFDGLMTAQMNAFDVPGAAVAVVQDGRLLFAKGYGYA